MKKTGRKKNTKSKFPATRKTYKEFKGHIRKGAKALDKKTKYTLKHGHQVNMAMGKALKMPISVGSDIYSRLRNRR